MSIRGLSLAPVLIAVVTSNGGQVINVKKPYTVHVPGPSLLLALMLL